MNGLPNAWLCVGCDAGSSGGSNGVRSLSCILPKASGLCPTPRYRWPPSSSTESMTTVIHTATVLVIAAPNAPTKPNS
jgi:hypothetical protein